jgi:hypothetical protein
MTPELLNDSCVTETTIAEESDKRQKPIAMGANKQALSLVWIGKQKCKLSMNVMMLSGIRLAEAKAIRMAHV